MPYVTLLINGTGWSSGFPRLLSTKQLASAIAKAHSLKLPGAASRGKCIGDISCDIRVRTCLPPRYAASDPEIGRT